MANLSWKLTFRKPLAAFGVHKRTGELSLRGRALPRSKLKVHDIVSCRGEEEANYAEKPINISKGIRLLQEEHLPKSPRLAAHLTARPTGPGMTNLVARVETAIQEPGNWS